MKQNLNFIFKSISMLILTGIVAYGCHKQFSDTTLTAEQIATKLSTDNDFLQLYSNTAIFTNLAITTKKANSFMDASSYDDFYSKVEAAGKDELKLTALFNSQFTAGTDIIKLIEKNVTLYQTLDDRYPQLAGMGTEVLAKAVAKMQVTKSQGVSNSSMNASNKSDAVARCCICEFTEARSSCQTDAFLGACGCGLLAPTIWGAALCGVGVAWNESKCFTSANKAYAACDPTAPAE